MLLKTFLQLWGIPQVKISAQSDVVYPGVIAPTPPEMGSIESWTKKVIDSSGSKERILWSWNFASRKYRWIGWSYYRLCENFWWLIIVSRVQFRPNFGSKNVFLLNFTKILSFFWDLRFLISDIPKNIVFVEILVFSNTFGFSSGKLGPKMDQNCKLEPKFKISIDFSKHCVCLIKDYL